MSLTPKVSILVFDGFSPFHVSVPAIVFGDVLPDMCLFDVTFCSLSPGIVKSSHGMQVMASRGLEALTEADLVVIPYWDRPETRPSDQIINALCAAKKSGTMLIGLCLGTYPLAYSGVLDGCRAATHWEQAEDFSIRFPRIELDPDALYVQDGLMLTSAGTGAGLDCCLHVVRQVHGGEIANRIARRMVIPPHREGGQAQFIERPVPFGTRDAKINQLLDRLLAQLSDPPGLDALAQELGMSRRSLTRHFHKTTGMSVGDWITSARMRRSQELLETTDISLEAIAAEVGYGSATALRQQFRTRYGVSPQAWKKSFLRS